MVRVVVVLLVVGMCGCGNGMDRDELERRLRADQYLIGWTDMSVESMGKDMLRVFGTKNQRRYYTVTVAGQGDKLVRAEVVDRAGSLIPGEIQISVVFRAEKSTVSGHIANRDYSVVNDVPVPGHLEILARKNAMELVQAIEKARSLK